MVDQPLIRVLLLYLLGRPYRDTPGYVNQRLAQAADRACLMVAETAGVEPTVEMNPILLKPEGMSRSQVIVLGRRLKQWRRGITHRHRSSLFEVVRQTLAGLREEYDLVLIEGAGSPVELKSC